MSRKTLREFWENYPDSAQPLRAWYADVKKAEWKTPAEVKAIYKTASFVANNRIVFNIKANSYRLVVAVDYKYGLVLIRFIGTHKEYDKVDVQTV